MQEVRSRTSKHHRLSYAVVVLRDGEKYSKKDCRQDEATFVEVLEEGSSIIRRDGVEEEEVVGLPCASTEVVGLLLWATRESKVTPDRRHGLQWHREDFVLQLKMVSTSQPAPSHNSGRSGGTRQLSAFQGCWWCEGYRRFSVRVAARARSASLGGSGMVRRRE